MTKVNEEFQGSTLVTQEKVDKFFDKFLHANCTMIVDEKAVELVRRMWQEIKDLRATLEKQMY